MASQKNTSRRFTRTQLGLAVAPVLLLAALVASVRSEPGEVQPCQYVAPGGVFGVHAHGGCPDCPQWVVPGQCPSPPYEHGNYVMPERIAHVPEYRLRVDDELEFVFRQTRNETSRPYRLNVGDEIRIESLADPKLNRDLVVQPDGTITLLLLGQVRATRHTVAQLREEVERLYSKYYKRPEVAVTPLKVNTRLQDILNSVDRRAGEGGQVRFAKVTPEGTISLPAINVAPAQGLTLTELKLEVDARYAAIAEGLDVTPILVRRAPRFVYVLGEVLHPGRYVMEGPTNVLQALSMAGGVTTAASANLDQVTIFRRDHHWRMVATMVDVRNPVIHGAAKGVCRVEDLWLSDSDVVVVPKTRIQVLDEHIDAVFRRGIYGVLPFEGITVNFAKLSTL